MDQVLHSLYPELQASAATHPLLHDPCDYDLGSLATSMSFLDDVTTILAFCDIAIFIKCFCDLGEPHGIHLNLLKFGSLHAAHYCMVVAGMMLPVTAQ